MFHKGIFSSPPIPLELDSEGTDFKRADIEVLGLDQSGASFEGRIFLNNPGANLDTPTTPETGYAGAFHVYGYGTWPSDVGKNRETHLADSERVRAPIHKVVIATEALRRAAAQSRQVTVTIVPVYPGNPPRDAAAGMKLEGVRIVMH
ncbi:MAG TPA: hypothetical protein VKZ53_27670 [Candidatus Angelobacter sp.]|nr:hypothetical protein [Candidatus Angelobacter sp.]